MGDLIQSLFGSLLTFAIVLVGVNYFLRYTFENRYLNSKSDYLISNTLVQMLILLTFSFWSISLAAVAGEQLFEGSEHDGGVGKLCLAFMIVSIVGALVVSITTAMSIYHVFRRNSNANSLKNLSYVGIALVGLTSILGLIFFVNIPKLSVICIIIFIILLAMACWFEYQYCQSVDNFFKGGQEFSFQERILKLLEAQAAPAGSTQVVEAVPQKFCPNCGEKIDATSKVCPVCGEETKF